jgi:hypothetical protein
MGGPLRFLFLRRLVLAFAEHPERDRDEHDQYGDHEQIRYTFPHTVSLVAFSPKAILT